MRITVIDSIHSDLFDVELRADHAERLAMHKKIRNSPVVNTKGEIIGSRIEMNHTDFITYINECAI